MERIAKKYGPWVLVTGASSGIGTEIAKQAAAQGLNVVVVARRKELLQELASNLSSDFGVQTRVIVVDLSDEQSLELIKERTGDLDIGLLVNNAGFGRTGDLHDHGLSEEVSQLHVNARAPLMLAHHFGQQMRARKRGGIVFLASTVAYAGVPGWSGYAATKAFILTLADGVARELKPHGIDVLTVSPGPTQTGFWKVADGKPLLALSAQRVAKAAFSNLGRRTNVVVGNVNKLISLSTRFAPRWMNALIFGVVIGMMRNKQTTAALKAVSQPSKDSAASENVGAPA